MVTFVVGPSAAKFTVHRSLLTATSAYFRSALNGNWLENSGRIDFPDEDPTKFSVYVQYLYFGKLFTYCCPPAPVTKRSSPTHAEIDEEWLHLIKLYFLGEYLQDPTFKNGVIDGILEKSRQLGIWPTGFSALIYENTPKTSELRHLFFDFHVWGAQAAYLGSGQTEEDLPNEFLRDVIDAFVAAGAGLYGPVSESRFPTLRERCAYHEHKEGVLCKD